MVKAHDTLLEGLNPAQREAVQHIDGPLLIVAGPGSGKTRVITHRIAYLVRAVDLPPSRIAAVTFTNRAAREMRERLERLLGVRFQGLSAGTFHALCARILREDGEVIGIPRDYVIMDDSDQIEVVKRAMEEVQVDPKQFPPRGILSLISAAKSELISPQGYQAQADVYYEEVAAKVYEAYQALLTRSHGLDFDDLLAKAVELFRSAPPVLSKYQKRYVHLMVDEFQDTNVAQYQLARMLAAKYENICVVGDPDQSIYSWRNADIRNILSFRQDYPRAKVVNLSQNYRSTKTILEAAQHVIAENHSRLEQHLFTDNDQGVPIVMSEAYTEEEEAEMALDAVERLARDGDYALRDVVVAYRVNAQSRALEEACLRHGVPYKLIGGTRFYQRREIKDTLAYLRLARDPYDEVSLARVINVPARGIGRKTLDDLFAWAASLGVPPYTALQVLGGDEAGRARVAPSPFAARQREQLLGFLGLLNGLREQLDTANLPQFVELTVERTGYRRMLLESGEPDADDRLDNLRELQNAASDWEGTSEDVLGGFLEQVALVSEQDELEDGQQQYLTLITLHQIKGLEFPVVIMVGMEEGVLPHLRSMDDPGQLEEERRICYVGMTRAKDRLCLLRSFRRRLYGAVQGNPPSRFLRDVPDDLVEVPGRQRPGTQAVAYDRWSTPSASAVAAAAPFKAGDKVSHAAFGQGIIVSCLPSGNDYELTVAFTGGSGVRRLLHTYANLERVD